MIYPNLHFKPRLCVLNEDQIEQIHLATLEVLERTGVQITHPRALEILDGAGARVVAQGAVNRVHIPGYMIEDAIRSAPPRVVLGRRDGERAVFFLEAIRPGSGRAWTASITWTRSPMSGGALAAPTVTSPPPSPTPCPIIPG